MSFGGSQRFAGLVDIVKIADESVFRTDVAVLHFQYADIQQRISLAGKT